MVLPKPDVLTTFHHPIYDAAGKPGAAQRVMLLICVGRLATWRSDRSPASADSKAANKPLHSFPTGP
jgi:hypothetical protein